MEWTHQESWRGIKEQGKLTPLQSTFIVSVYHFKFHSLHVYTNKNKKKRAKQLHAMSMYPFQSNPVQIQINSSYKYRKQLD